MAQHVRMWKISAEDTLQELQKSKLNFEERLETWIENDISIISDDLIVIGRQVQTDFGGVIDVLCLNIDGDLVIIELKRDRTPREITAQTLDYASWVDDLTIDRITELANTYFGKNGTIEEVFKNKFGEEFPESVNERHKMLIVASEIDASSERIIKYLSDSYGVGINAITFQYFQCPEGNEYLSRVFLIEPSEVDYKARIRPSKKARALSFEEFHEIAKNNGVEVTYELALEGFRQCFNRVTRYVTGIAFKGILDENKSYGSILVLYPTESSSEKGLNTNLYIDRFSEFFELEKNVVLDVFPSPKEKDYVDGVGDVGIFYLSEDDVNKVLSLIRQ